MLCSEQCQSCIDDCDDCALNVSFGGGAKHNNVDCQSLGYDNKVKGKKNNSNDDLIVKKAML